MNELEEKVIATKQLLDKINKQHIDIIDNPLISFAERYHIDEQIRLFNIDAKLMLSNKLDNPIYVYNDSIKPHSNAIIYNIEILQQRYSKDYIKLVNINNKIIKENMHNINSNYKKYVKLQNIINKIRKELWQLKISNDSWHKRERYELEDELQENESIQTKYKNKADELRLNLLKALDNEQY